MAEAHKRFHYTLQPPLCLITGWLTGWAANDSSARLGASRRQRRRGTAAIADKLASGEVTVAEVTANEVVQLRSAQEQLSSVRVRIDTAANQYANAVKKLGKTKLDEAVEFYLRHHDQQTEEIDAAQLVERFLAFKETSGVSAAYHRDLRNRARSLVEFHCRSSERSNAGPNGRIFQTSQF